MNIRKTNPIGLGLIENKFGGLQNFKKDILRKTKNNERRNRHIDKQNNRHTAGASR